MFNSFINCDAISHEKVIFSLANDFDASIAAYNISSIYKLPSCSVFASSITHFTCISVIIPNYTKKSINGLKAML